MNWLNRELLSPIEEIIDEARNGRMIILVDDEDRENEGDLIIPAQMATPEAINFMAKHGRGLICLALTRDRVDHLGLPLMTRDNLSRHQTAFTVSIEARDGITTGISAPDRARSIAVAIDPNSSRNDIVSPGHVFPLVARAGGVLVRAGHTEASVDIARLAGLNPSAVICEVMHEDGTMARLPDLIEFARCHGIKIATIADLIAYRRRHDRIVERIAERQIVSRYGGEWHLIVYKNTVAYAEHLALIKGDLTTDGPVLVRMHAVNILTDVLGENKPGAGDLQTAMKVIGAEGRGAVVVIREPRATSLSDRVLAEANPDNAAPDRELRDYGVGAQILLDCGVRDMVLLTNSNRTVIGLDGYGLRIVDRRRIDRGGDVS
jgi:3,4-dihydroxy 2-butanone 4-phosphate synthase/GTP cyclohydrolase II